MQLNGTSQTMERPPAALIPPMTAGEVTAALYLSGAPVETLRLPSALSRSEVKRLVASALETFGLDEIRRLNDHSRDVNGRFVSLIEREEAAGRDVTRLEAAWRDAERQLFPDKRRYERCVTLGVFSDLATGTAR